MKFVELILLKLLPVRLTFSSDGYEQKSDLHFYKIHTNIRGNYESARNVCRSEGSDVAIFKSSEEYAVLRSFNIYSNFLFTIQIEKMG